MPRARPNVVVPLPETPKMSTRNVTLHPLRLKECVLPGTLCAQARKATFRICSAPTTKPLLKIRNTLGR
jgi:hypothetical protein